MFEISLISPESLYSVYSASNLQCQVPFQYWIY